MDIKQILLIAGILILAFIISHIARQAIKNNFDKAGIKIASQTRRIVFSESVSGNYASAPTLT